VSGPSGCGGWPVRPAGGGGRPGPPTSGCARRTCEGVAVTARRSQPQAESSARSGEPGNSEMAGARGVRTYVLDTSVLLSDPWAITRFAEHSVVLPLVVISELEGKRHHPELGWFAREALRALDELRLRHGRLDA